MAPPLAAKEWAEAAERVEELDGPANAGFFGHVLVAGELGVSDPEMTSRWSRAPSPKGVIITSAIYERIALGEAALRAADPERAVQLLEEPVEFLRDWGLSAYFLGAESPGDSLRGA